MSTLSDIQARARVGLSARVTKVAAPAALTDNSGGVAVDGTIAAVNSSATAADGIKELATKVNALRTQLVAAGVMS